MSMQATTMAVALDLVREFAKSGQPVFIHGPAGIGKTEGVAALAHSMFGPKGFKTFIASCRESVDVRGMPFPDAKAKKTIWLTPDELPREERDGPEGIWFMDEYNTAPQQTRLPLMSLVCSGELEGYVKPKGWTIVAAGNRRSDKAVVTPLTGPEKNRFAHITVEPDLESWVQWAFNHDVHPAAIAFHKFRPELLHKASEAGDDNAFPTPRSIVRASQHLDKSPSIRAKLIAAQCGDAYAGEIEAFMRVYMGLPSIDRILKDPKGVHCPGMGEPNALYALATALTKRATPANVHNVMEYAQRMPKEFEIMMAHDISKRDPSFKSTKVFVDFALRNKDAIL